jgi:hypothetical protein
VGGGEQSPPFHMDIQILCNTDDETLFANIEANSKLYPHWVKMSEAHD